MRSVPFNPSQPTLDELIEASSLGTPEAVALREEGRQLLEAKLTGMPEEQADWEAVTDGPQQVVGGAKDLRDRIKDAYDDSDCEHNDRIVIGPRETYVVVPCGDCVADVLLAALRDGLPLDLATVEPWMQVCGPCDYGIHNYTGCACPEGDPRPVVVKLVAEIERLRAELAARGGAA